MYNLDNYLPQDDFASASKLQLRMVFADFEDLIQNGEEVPVLRVELHMAHAPSNVEQNFSRATIATF